MNQQTSSSKITRYNPKSETVHVQTRDLQTCFTMELVLELSRLVIETSFGAADNLNNESKVNGMLTNRQ